MMHGLESRLRSNERELGWVLGLIGGMGPGLAGSLGPQYLTFIHLLCLSPFSFAMQQVRSTELEGGGQL